MSAIASIVRDRSQHPDIRAGAAWALGEMNNRDGLTALIESFSEAEDLLRVEAARALAKLSTQFSADVLEAFPHASPDRRPGIAWALSKAGTFEITEVLNLLVDEDARQGYRVPGIEPVSFGDGHVLPKYTHSIYR